jgi:multidrug efflux pump subunit AcrB
MNITRAAIEKNRITFIALLVILAGGIVAYFDLPRAEDPGFIIRTATVVTHFPGASPERVEMLVTDKLEKVIQEIPELDFLQSESKAGVSIVFVNIQERYKQMRPIWDSLRRKVDRATSDLPEGIIGPTVNDEFGDVFGIIITVTGEGYSYAEVKEVADQVRDLLLRLGEVAKVDIYGAQEERVFVEYNNARLAEIGLSPVQLKTILEDRNIIIPGGSISTGVERISLEPTGSFESIEDLKHTVITLPGRSEVVFLEDLAEVRRGYIDPPTNMLASSGEIGLGLAVSMREGGDIIQLGEEVKALVERIRGRYPIGIDFDIVAFQPDDVDSKVKSFVGNVQQAVAIVLAVMLLLLGLRTGLVVASLIPTAMIMSLMVMSFFDIGLDQVSLAALIIALGMLVDNAIVMSESIMVQMAAGKAAKDAAVDSARELLVPLLVSSLTMVPLLCVTFLRVKTRAGEASFDSRFYRAYRAGLLLAVRHPYVLVAAVIGLFVLAMNGMQHVPKIFFPPSDKPRFTAELELPLGTAIERTEQVAREIDRFVKQELTAGPDRPEGVTNWSTYIGQGGPRFTLGYSPTQRSPEFTFMLLNATSEQVMPSLVSKMERFCADRYPDLLATIRPLNMGPPIVHPVEVRLSGENIAELFAISDGVKAKLASMPGAKNITDDWGQRTKKLVVAINGPRARRAGVSHQDVALSLQTVLSGFDTTDYREGDEVIPITLRSVAADRRDMGKLESLNVYSQASGQSVPLKQVADISVVWQPARIYRRDRQKTVSVYCGTGEGVTAASVTSQISSWLEAEKENWPLGYFYELGGEMETSGKANRSIGEQLPVAGLIILLLLVGQFNSIRRTAIILLTIPLAMIGVTAGLLIADSYFGFMTLLGIISLAGIVINNAIVLIDRIRIEIQENGLDPPRAVIEAAQRRLRPILLTTATTVGGLIPLWVGGGPMWEPMAISIIFGLVFATVLTLGVVPALYTILFRVKFKGFAY